MSGTLSDLAKVTEALGPGSRFQISLVSRIPGLDEGIGQGTPRGWNLSVPIRISMAEHFKNESEKKELPTLSFPFLSW